MLGLLALLEETAGHGGGGFNPLDPHQWGTAFWTWVIFFAALPFMIKFVFGPIARALDALDRKVQEDAQAAARAREEAEKARDEIRRELQEIRAKQEAMLAEARAKAEAQARELQEKAKAEAERLLERSRAAIEQEKRKALSEIRAEVVELTIKAAGKVLERDVDDQVHRTFVEGLLAGGPRGSKG